MTGSRCHITFLFCGFPSFGPQVPAKHVLLLVWFRGAHTVPISSASSPTPHLFRRPSPLPSPRTVLPHTLPRTSSQAAWTPVHTTLHTLLYALHKSGYTTLLIFLHSHPFIHGPSLRDLVGRRLIAWFFLWWILCSSWSSSSGNLIRIFS